MLSLHIRTLNYWISPKIITDRALFVFKAFLVKKRKILVCINFGIGKYLIGKLRELRNLYGYRLLDIYIYFVENNQHLRFNKVETCQA